MYSPLRLMLSYILISLSLIGSWAENTENYSIRKNWSKSDFGLKILASTAANITWEPSVNETGSAIILQITAHSINSSLFEHYRRVESSTGIAHFNSLNPFTLYKFIVKEVNFDGVLAEIGPIRTWPSAPSLSTLYIRALPYREIELRWNEPRPANGILKPYEVHCFEIDGNSTFYAKTTERLVTFKNLLLKTFYQCTLKVSTYPEKEQDPKECEVIVKSSRVRTYDIIFPYPRLISVDPNTVNITIADVKFKGESFKNYEILVQKGRGDINEPWQSMANVSAVAQTYTARELKDDTRYAFIVCGRNFSLDNSACSSPRSVITPQHELGPPTYVTLEIINRHEVLMSWDPPTHHSEDEKGVQDYSISWSLDGEEQEDVYVSQGHSHTFKNLWSGQSLTALVRCIPSGIEPPGPFSDVQRITLPRGEDGRILAMFTPIDNNTLNITIENDVYAGTQPREMDVIIRKGGINAPTQFDVVGTFDWPDQRFHLLHDLTPNTLYGIKLMRFEKYTGTLEDSISGSVYIPNEEGGGANTTSSDTTTAQSIVFHVRSSHSMLCSCSCNSTYSYPSANHH